MPAQASLLVLLFMGGISLGATTPSKFPTPKAAAEADRNYWHKLAADGINERLQRPLNTRRARNVVLFVGDGMGVPTVTAARIYKGQRLHQSSGEEEQLSWETFPHVSVSKTYGLDAQTSDSANTATAFLCGVKANVATIGVDSRVKRGSCHNDSSTHLTSIMQWAQDAGMWTGIVTTSKLTDATPAASYAHAGLRDWESSLPGTCDAEDIAYQLVHRQPGSDFKVILGGGREMFRDRSMADEEMKPGRRLDGGDLIKAWRDAKAKLGNATYIWTRQDLRSVEADKTDFLLGVFDSDHLPYVIDRSSRNSTKPTLPEMTRVAVQILRRAPKGFLLLVEGARIDMAHHNNHGMSALEETLELDQAVFETHKTLDTNETLLVVTADHSHVFTISGYPERGTNILGIAGNSDVNHLPYTILTYANGPGYTPSPRNFATSDTAKPDYMQQAALPLKQETHGGEDVVVYASGPWAHLYSGVHDQSYIPHVMAYAACMGPFAGAKCATTDKTTSDPAFVGLSSGAAFVSVFSAALASAMATICLR